MKKIKTSLAVFLLSSQVFAAEIALSVKPAFTLPFDSMYENTLAGKVGLEFSPFTTVRGRDSIVFGFNAGVTPLMADGLNNVFAFEGETSLGYSLRFADRFNLTAEGYGGVWMIPGGNSEAFPETKGDFLYGGRASLNFYVLPGLQLGAFADYGIMNTKTDPFMKNFSAGINLRYSFTNGLFTSSKLETKEIQTDQLFPVFYSYYSEHPFGALTFENKESNTITDVEVSVFVEQFMSNPEKTFTAKKVARGETFTVPLVAFLNENILNTMSVSETAVQVKVNYKSLGKRKQFTQNIVLNTVSRNSMTWEDDRRAAAFVSGRDSAAYSFAQRVKSIVRDYLDPDVPQNIQYAAAIFSALKVYGINYVIDPASAFVDNVGTKTVDFLQFPYQTLLYHGGDCDDLTILNCALLESLGIKTAFITVPGHIYMAFDSGVSVYQKEKVKNHVIFEGIVWIPLEITLCQDDFAIERQTGFRQFVKYGRDAVLIPLSRSWLEYKAVSMSDSDVKLEYPLSEEILTEFKKQEY